MNYVDLAVAQRQLLERIGDRKTDATDTRYLMDVYERLVAIEKPTKTTAKS